MQPMQPRFLCSAVQCSKRCSGSGGDECGHKMQEEGSCRKGASLTATWQALWETCSVPLTSREDDGLKAGGVRIKGEQAESFGPNDLPEVGAKVGGPVDSVNKRERQTV